MDRAANPSVEWSEVATGWHRWTPTMRQWYQPATELMLDLAHIGPGSHVLDVAAGDGDQSLSTAARAGPSGRRVLATDLSPELLAFARRSAEKAGVTNLETRVMDAEDLRLADASFDAVVCRFGLMLFSEPDRALREMHRVLRRSGRAAMVVYAEQGSPEQSLVLSAAGRFLGIEEPLPERATSLGDEGVLAGMLARAGFHGVEVHPTTVEVRLASAAECAAYLRDASPTLNRLLAQAGPDRQKDGWEEIELALSRFEGPEGFEVENRLLVAGATPS